VDKPDFVTCEVDLASCMYRLQSSPSYGFAISQSGTPPGMLGSNGMSVTSTVSSSSHPPNTGSIDSRNSTSASNVMAAHAQQYLQAMMHQNGFASLPFPFSGTPGQVKRNIKFFFLINLRESRRFVEQMSKLI
jgi:hypothetical protein